VTSYPDGHTPSFGYSLPSLESNGPTRGQARDLNDLSLIAVYEALGGKVNPSTRGKQWAEGTCWGPHTNGTDKYNLRLNEQAGGWSCHCGGKGRKLALVVFARAASDPKSALKWLIEQGLLTERERDHPNGTLDPACPRTVASYRYDHESGVPFARVDRVEPGRHGKDKEFFPHLWEGKGYAKKSGLAKKTLPLYRAPELRRAIEAGECVFIVEGEGKGDRLRTTLEAAKIAGAVTTVAGGSGAPLKDEHLQQLRGLKSAVILADSDEPGRAAAQLRAGRIAQRGAELKIIDLFPEATTPEHPAWAWDVADFLKDGSTVEQLLALIESTPLFTPSASTTAEAGLTQRADGKKSSRVVHLVSAASIKPIETQYVVYPYIPRGEATWFEGQTKTGKTMVAIDIIARVTNGLRFVNGEPIEQGNVAIITCEDDPARGIIPRLIVAGANLEHVFMVTALEQGEERQVAFFQDVEGIEKQLRERNVALVFVDGAFGFLNVRDATSYTEAYGVMLPFVGMVRRLNVGTLIVRHLRKASGTALERGMGSAGYGALARSTLTVAVDHHNKEQRIFAHAGCNVGPIGDSYTFTIEPAEVEGFERSVGHAVWGKQIDITADEAVGESSIDDDADRSLAEEFLFSTLREAMPASEVYAKGKEQGVSVRTLRRAAKKVGIRIERRGFGEGSVWYPPTADEHHSGHSGHSGHAR
jgi:putative DNA primase/helicase